MAPLRHVATTAVALLVLAGCGSGGPSLDQRQQAWEQETRELACESYKRVGGEYTAMDQAGQDLSNGVGDQTEAMRRLLELESGVPVPDECVGRVFERYAREVAVRSFPDSPRGQAGETTVPLVPR